MIVQEIRFGTRDLLVPNVYLYFIRGEAVVEFFLSPIQRIGGSLYTIICILHSQTDNIQELAFVEGTSVLGGLPSAISDGETLAG